MRLLFVLNTPGFLRYYDETIASLLERGHEVVLGFTNARMRAEALEALAGADPRPEVIGEVPGRTDAYALIAARLRTLVDFARYLDPSFARAEWLRDRRRHKVLESPLLARLLGERDTLPRPLARALVRGLLVCERALPSAREVEACIRDTRTDAVLVSPLVTGGSPQTDYVKSARALGLPSAACIASWDNLTNKGLMREQPDRVIVWNEAQRREAVTMHDVPSERVAVTGAQPFDRWFGREPTADRATFCARVGLDPARPFLLFVGSTSNIADPGAEDRFVARWVRELRRSGDPDVRSAGILVRPHPDRRGPWITEHLRDLDGAVVWPPERPNSVTPAARGDYFDSLFHAAVIVGINTSAMVEGAVIGRPVATVRLPELEQAQHGTLHFDHLLPAAGGPLFVASSFPEHARQVGELLRDPAPARLRNERFVASFIRPQGLDAPSTPRVVAAIEELAELRPHAARAPLAALPRPLLLVAGRLAARPRRELRAADFRRARRRAAHVDFVLRTGAHAVRPVAPPLARGLEAAGASVQARAAARKAASKGIREADKRRSRETARRLKRRAEDRREAA